MESNADNEHNRAIASDFDKSFEMLERIEQSSRNRIPEALFSGVFLGLFANLENKHPNGTIENWIAIAGSPFNKVDVVQDNKVIFTVPPVFNKNAISPRDLDAKEPISHIVSIAEKLALRSPIESNNYLSNKYSNLNITKRENVMEYIQDWNTIFSYYKLPPIMEIKEETTPTEKVDSIQEELRNDDLDFTMI